MSSLPTPMPPLMNHNKADRNNSCQQVPSSQSTPPRMHLLPSRLQVKEEISNHVSPEDEPEKDKPIMKPVAELQELSTKRWKIVTLLSAAVILLRSKKVRTWSTYSAIQSEVPEDNFSVLYVPLKHSAGQISGQNANKEKVQKAPWVSMDYSGPPNNFSIFLSESHFHFPSILPVQHFPRAYTNWVQELLLLSYYVEEDSSTGYNEQ